MARPTIAIAAGALLLAGTAALVRGSRVEPRTTPSAPPVEEALPAPDDEGSAGVLPADVLDSRITAFVERLKGAGSAPSESLEELLLSCPMEELLHRIGSQAPLEHGFEGLRRLIAERPALRRAVMRVVASPDVDEETRLFALRLLPPFPSLAGDSDRDLLLRLVPPPGGEPGRQLVRYISGSPLATDAGVWLSRVAERCDDPSVKADVLRALARWPDPIAESILKRHLEDPAVPDSQRAAILGALSVPGVAARYLWLPDALERTLRIRPGDSLEAAFHAVTILGLAGDTRRLSTLMEIEKGTSDPGGRALIAFALRWLPGEDAARTLVAMASNPDESTRVRTIALESLRGRK